jgi:hypothetical protein
VIGYVPTGLVIVAVEVHWDRPVTPDVLRDCPFTKPEIVESSVGRGEPTNIVWSFPVTTSGAEEIVRLTGDDSAEGLKFVSPP